MGGCVSGKQQKKDIPFLRKTLTSQQVEIKIIKAIQQNSNTISQKQIVKNIIEQQPQLQEKIFRQKQPDNEKNNSNNILKDILKLSQQCIKAYQDHQIDRAYKILIKIKQDLKQLQMNGYVIKVSNQHFRQQFLNLFNKVQMEYKDLLDFNNQILKGKWKVKNQKNNLKVSSKIQGNDVGILVQTILQVPFENFIAVMIQMDLYKNFLPFIIKSEHLKDVSRNCKLGFLELKLPIISNRQSYFQGIIYNRLKNQNIQDQQFFMYTRSIHNRLDLQKSFNYKIQMNKECVAFEYKYIAIKYVPLTANSGKMIMGLNIDLKLNFIPVSIIQMATISFSEDFYHQILRISKRFQGSPWQQGIKKDPELFDFLKIAKNQYLSQKINNPSK